MKIPVWNLQIGFKAHEDKEVVIRTVDIGADKQLDYIDIPKEDNPFRIKRHKAVSCEQGNVQNSFKSASKSEYAWENENYVSYDFVVRRASNCKLYSRRMHARGAVQTSHIRET